MTHLNKVKRKTNQKYGSNHVKHNEIFWWKFVAPKLIDSTTHCLQKDDEIWNKHHHEWVIVYKQNYKSKELIAYGSSEVKQ